MIETERIGMNIIFRFALDNSIFSVAILIQVYATSARRRIRIAKHEHSKNSSYDALVHVGG